MEEFVKTILYAYPLLKTVGKDYEEHIRNKALLSYRSGGSAENLAEYLAEEILCKRRLEWLKEKIDCVLDKLDQVEKTLVKIRYFGLERKIKRPMDHAAGGEKNRYGEWSESKYFRRQNKLLSKMKGLFVAAGVNEEIFLKEFSILEPFREIYRFVSDGRDRKISLRERRWLRF